MSAAGFRQRLIALMRKELRQMLRDKSSMAVGLVLPAALILLFGYGLSFDVKNAPIAVVIDQPSPPAFELVGHLQGSPYLAPERAANMAEAEQLLRRGEVDAIVRLPSDFVRDLSAGDARIQLLVNGSNTTTAQTVGSYVSGAIAGWSQRQLERSGSASAPGARVELVPRMWFNEAGNSSWYLVPGLLVLVLTLIGAFLTSLLIAREWERGTLESLFVTPVRPIELLLAKLAPYLVIGAIDVLLCLLAAKLLFHVPIRGSLPVIFLTSMLYLTVSLLLGLFISGVTRNQFQASQIALLTSFLPAMMLSGFVFDLRNVPVGIQLVSNLLPATHFMGMIKALFLSGNNWPVILRNSTILFGYAVVLVWATRRVLRKKLD